MKQHPSTFMAYSIETYQKNKFLDANAPHRWDYVWILNNSLQNSFKVCEPFEFFDCKLIDMVRTNICIFNITIAISFDCMYPNQKVISPSVKECFWLVYAVLGSIAQANWNVKREWIINYRILMLYIHPTHSSHQCQEYHVLTLVIFQTVLLVFDYLHRISLFHHDETQ